MRSLFRIFSLGLICSLLIASSDATVNMYGYRSGPSIVAAQGVVVVNPSAYQTPAYPEHLAVNSPLNTGHAPSSADAPVDETTTTQSASCRWFGFPAVTGGKLSVKLKVEYTSSGARQLPAYNAFTLSYSLDGGSNWTDAISRSGFTSSQSGTFTLDLPISQDLTQVQVRDVLTAGATINTFASAAATVSNIRIEVDTVNCFASVPGDRWRGEYYNNQTLTGSPAMVRDDGPGFLNLNFGASPSLACGLGSDYFSTRWTRTVNFAQGIYRFTASADNGARLYIDGQLKIDQWGDSPPSTYTADAALTAGAHEIKLEFVEYTGGAGASLSWVDVTHCFANVPAGRWKGEYYNNTSLAGAPWMARDDGAGFLNFDFGLGSPGASCGLGVDNFSARWTRTANFGPGIYRFSVIGDDGVRLYVDGQMKIDKLFSQGATTYTADVALNAGNHVVKLEYFESGGPGMALLSWTLVSGLSCLPDAMIGNAPRTDGGESVATTPVSGEPKRCGQKSSD